ncbi:MAG: hypothetical protein JW991_00820 [Candidatus Pacebacteria bacterium]|nr:hypothetical protein [Candidatus Paceibacterota bacterium]
MENKILHTVLPVALVVGGIVLAFNVALLPLVPRAVPSRVLGKFTACKTIQQGDLLTSDGYPITSGYDGWGYNYQARSFNGFYCDSYRNAAWCQPYKDVRLAMKWNDAWLSNRDCDGDGLLDRHYGFAGYVGSGAWLTNHQSGEYEQDGETCQWNYFVKIAAAPSGAYKENGMWYEKNRRELGPVIWDEFAVIQKVENDSCAGSHGLQYRTPVGPGFGQFR